MSDHQHNGVYICQIGKDEAAEEAPINLHFKLQLQRKVMQVHLLLVGVVVVVVVTVHSHLWLQQLLICLMQEPLLQVGQVAEVVVIVLNQP